MQKSFLQSEEWEEFQNSIENQTFRVDDVLLIKKSLPIRKSYLYAPRIGIINQELGITNFLNKTTELAKKENCAFLRIDIVDKPQVTSHKLRRTNDVQPSQTVILNLKKTEEELLFDMHQKTRYNIRLAEKKGVKIKESNDVNIFWQLTKETTKRDRFKSYGKEYYKKIIASDMIKLYVAEYDNKILAAGIFVFYGETVTYLHGASTHEDKNVMAPYLLHWEMIKLAQREGYKYYDFFGIDEKKWPGITRFKKGFSGEEISYPGTFDVVFSRAWYTIYNLVRVLYKLVRALRKIF